MRTIGVIGGMGPAATFDFCARLVALNPVAREQDHPRVLVDCDPAIPDRNAAARGDGPSPGPVLAAKARALEVAGAQLLAMPCNTAHAHAPDIESAVGVPFIDMIAATVAAAPSGAPVGVLAADGCVAAGLYQRAFAAAGGAALLPDPAAQARFMTLLYRIKGGDLSGARAGVKAIAEALLSAGAAAIVAGCTEVPLVLAQDDLPAPLVSSTDALALAVLRAAR